jgi:hypothetical protein
MVKRANCLHNPEVESWRRRRRVDGNCWKTEKAFPYWTALNVIITAKG